MNKFDLILLRIGTIALLVIPFGFLILNANPNNAGLMFYIALAVVYTKLK